MLLCLLLCFPKEHKQKLILLFLRLFLLALVEHISQVFHRAPSPTQDDYISRTSGEVPSKIIPNFSILKERTIYEKNCHNQDKRALKDNCEKDFPTHSGLTPGLYLWMQTKVSLWIFNDAQSREPLHALRHYYN